MSDLPYKLNQLSQRLHIAGDAPSARIVISAADEIVRLLATLEAKHEPGPATSDVLLFAKAVVSTGSGWSNQSKAMFAKFLAEWEDQ